MLSITVKPNADCSDDGDSPLVKYGGEKKDGWNCMLVEYTYSTNMLRKQ